MNFESWERMTNQLARRKRTMDPAACWNLILECLDDENYWDAMFHLEELQDWIRLGGFLPPYISPAVLSAVEAGIRSNLD